MALDTVEGNGSFYLKPGGAMEEALPTELAADQYTQSSGITHTGRLIRMPGKRLQQQFQDGVLQIAGFGGAVIIQHGTTIIMYPDACAISPTDDDDPRKQQVVLDTVTPKFNEQFNVTNTPNPWTTHPNTGRFGYPYPPPFYFDVAPDATNNTYSQNTASQLYIHVDLQGYTNTTGDGGAWTYLASVTCNQSVGQFDLTQYSAADYVKATLKGPLTTRASTSPDPAHWDGSYTTETGQFEIDVTSHLGRNDVISLPYPSIGGFQYHFLRDSENTGFYYWDVRINQLELTHRTAPGS